VITAAPAGHNECTKNLHLSRMVVVRYSFEVDGRSFFSSQFTADYVGEVECSEADAKTTKEKYENTKSMTIHYDPKDPARSVVRLPDALVVYLFGPILGGLFLGLLVAFIRKKKTPSEANEAW